MVRPTINRRQVDHYGMSIKGVEHPRFYGTLVADVTIDNSRSDLTINIDNGEVFNHRWNAMGHPDKSFKEFLTESGGSVDYFKGKVASETVFDAKATLQEMKSHLLEYRRDTTIDSEQARRVWNILFVKSRGLSSSRSVDEFCRDIDENVIGEADQDAMELLWDHSGQFGCHMKYPNTIDVFFELMWAPLVEELKKELEAPYVN